MAFTSDELTAIRMYCGFGAYGSNPSQEFGYRYFTSYGLLEYRMANLQTSEETVVRAKLTALATLDAAIPLAGANLDTAEAAVWKHNPVEVKDREALYKLRRKDLCAFFNVSPGPGLGSGGGLGV